MKNSNDSIEKDAQKIFDYTSKSNIERLILLINDPESSLINLLSKEDNEYTKDYLYKSLMEIRMYLSLLTYLQRLFVFHNEDSFTGSEMHCLLDFANDTSSFLDHYGVGPIHDNRMYYRCLKSDMLEHIYSKGIDNCNVDEDFIQRIENMSEVEFEILVLIAFETVYTDRYLMEFGLHKKLTINDTDHSDENREDDKGDPGKRSDDEITA